MVVRRRLIFWLIRAYIEKRGKTILFSFLAGLSIFFIFIYSSRFLLEFFPTFKHDVIGIAGTYSTDNLPSFIVEKISKGLTSINANGVVKPEIADRWDILDDGRTYVFHLKKDLYFSNGENITSKLINYKFSDVAIDRPDASTIVFKLKDNYAPFLVTVSRPVFLPGLIGAGDYKIADLKLNGNFVQSLTIASVKNRFAIKTYEFHPSEDTLKYAYVLGEVTQAIGLENTRFNDTYFDKFGNTIVNKKINYKKLVTLFYNNNDNILSNTKVRLALSYALPNNYPNSEKSFLPYKSTSIYYNNDLEDKKQNYEHARLLLAAASAASESANLNDKLNLSIQTLPKYRSVAYDIARSFGDIGIKVDITEVDKVPTDFQMYLGDIALSDDPDQYPLWHSAQEKNITKYKNLRIDKLLEDGRKTIDINARKKIYADFQKFLTDDVPASFLFFPMEYELKRK